MKNAPVGIMAWGVISPCAGSEYAYIHLLLKLTFIKYLLLLSSIHRNLKCTYTK